MSAAVVHNSFRAVKSRRFSRKLKIRPVMRDARKRNSECTSRSNAFSRAGLYWSSFKIGHSKTQYFESR